MLAPLFLIVLLAFVGVLWAFADDGGERVRCPHVLARSDRVFYDCCLDRDHVGSHYNTLARARWTTGFDDLLPVRNGPHDRGTHDVRFYDTVT